MKLDPTATIGRVSRGEDLNRDEMADVVGAMMDGGWSDDQIALLLTALRAKGESVAEVAGAALAMRRHMTPIHSTHPVLVDTCGTGGDASGTFNISTAAAIVTAATGVPVAKHGNRSITSKSGSADVLAALGVHIEAPVATVQRCLDEVGICFCFAPQLHPSMKHVAAVRRRLGVPTIFNMLGPLCNPASAPFQLLGAGNDRLRELLSAALAMLGAKRAIVVTGSDGLDEVTLSGPTRVADVQSGRIEQRIWQPADFGIEPAGIESLRVDGPEASAAMILEVLAGATGTARDIVVLNSAAAVWCAGVDADLAGCARRAEAAIDNGFARETLARLIRVGRS